MAPSRPRRRVASRTGVQAETERSRASPTRHSQSATSGRSQLPRITAVGERSRGEPSGPQGSRSDAPERPRSPDHLLEQPSARPSLGGRSPSPRGGDAPRSDRVNTAGQRQAQPLSGIRGPSAALAAAEALLQFPPAPVEDMPRMNSWVARLADLVGYAHNHPEPVQSRTPARARASARGTESTGRPSGRGHAGPGLAPAPRQRSREDRRNGRQGERRRDRQSVDHSDHISVGSSTPSPVGDLRRVLNDRRGEDARTRIERRRERHFRDDRDVDPGAQGQSFLASWCGMPRVCARTTQGDLAAQVQARRTRQV